MPWFYSLLFHKSHHRMEMRKKIVLKKYPYCLNFDITKDETKKVFQSESSLEVLTFIAFLLFFLDFIGF